MLHKIRHFSLYGFIKNNSVILLGLLLMAILAAVPTGYEDAVIYKGWDRCSASVISTDNSKIISTGLIQSGEQSCEIKLLGGKFKGQTTSGYNLLTGSLESDKIFEVGDKALVVVSYNDNGIQSVNMIDHYRINMELILALAFAAFLILFAGKNGLRAFMSFALTIMLIWKVMIPACLNGMNAIVVGLLLMVVITIVIIVLDYGFDKRSLVAILGSLLGIFTTCIMGIIASNLLKMHGAVMSYSESLIYSGFENLNITEIFMAGIFIGASGAVMDLSVDITSSIYEVVQKKPDIGWFEACKLGINVGRACTGTMTTTLLLAYSGGYLALLMVFMAQGTPIYNILNYKYVSAEILDTIVGSFGLVTVAPFTALVGGLVLTHRKKDKQPVQPFASE